MIQPVVIAFYSFRGGVGRSMSMLNTACLLAGTGRRVLMVDFDLEAPGLTHLIERQDLVVDKPQAAAARGMVDIFHDFLHTPETSLLSAESGHADLGPYLARLNVPKNDNPFAQGGSLHLLPAGLHSSYEQNLAELHLSSEEFGSLRKDFAAKLRAILLKSGLFDYVLIDSRTGFSDEGHLAAKFLCDFLVVLTGLNDQNIRGTAEVLSKIGRWKQEGSGPKGILMVASPVCEYEDDAKQARLQQVKRILREATQLNLDFALTLPYHPRLALYEELVALQWPESGLGRAYRQLAEVVRVMADDYHSKWAQRAAQALQEGKIEECGRALENVAALDLQQAKALARQISALLGQLEGEAAAKALPISATLSRIEPDEPLHPLQAARAARNAKLKSETVLAYLAEAEQLARKTNHIPALAAALQEQGNTRLADNQWTEAARVFSESAAHFSALGQKSQATQSSFGVAQAHRFLEDYTAARHGFQKALEVARELGNAQNISAILHSIAEMDRLEGDYPNARRGYSEALRIAREVEDRRGIAVTLLSLAQLDARQGEYALAQRGFEEALQLARQLNDHETVSIILHGLAESFQVQGGYAKAREGFEEALQAARVAGSRRGLLPSLSSLAELSCMQGDYAKARQSFDEALRIGREFNERSQIAIALHGLAVLELYQTNYAKARQGFEEALKIKQDLKDRHSVAAILHSLAELDRLEGDYATARWRLDETLRTSSALSDRRGISVAHLSQAELDHLLGDYTDARRGYEKALQGMCEVKDRRGLASGLLGLADLDRLQGDYAKARQRFDEALLIERELGDRRGVSAGLSRRAELDRVQGDYAKADQGFREALQISRELEDRRGVAVIELYLAATACLANAAAEIGHLLSALESVKQIEDPHVGARGYLLLGEVLRGRQQFQEAIAALNESLARARQRGFRDLVAFCQAELAVCTAALDRKEEAREAAKAALAFFAEQNVRHPLAQQLMQISAGAQG